MDINNLKILIKSLLNLNQNEVNKLIQTNLSTCFLHQKTFSKFKNIHQGQDIVIVASGVSGEKYLSNIKENAIHIGVNRSFQAGNYKIPMDYVFIQDYSGKTQEYIEDLNEYRKDKCQKFYGLTLEWKDNYTIPESHAVKANALRYRTDWTNILFHESEFAYDISTHPLGCFGSIVFPALQFALWTYPKRIFLVGCDCTTSGYSYNKNDKNFLIPKKIISAYNKFKEFKNKYYPDVEIISINPVGLKGVFKDIYLE